MAVKMGALGLVWVYENETRRGYEAWLTVVLVKYACNGQGIHPLHFSPNTSRRLTGRPHPSSILCHLHSPLHSPKNPPPSSSPPLLPISPSPPLPLSPSGPLFYPLHPPNTSFPNHHHSPPPVISPSPLAPPLPPYHRRRNRTLKSNQYKSNYTIQSSHPQPPQCQRKNKQK